MSYLFIIISNNLFKHKPRQRVSATTGRMWHVTEKTNTVLLSRISQGSYQWAVCFVFRCHLSTELIISSGSFANCCWLNTTWFRKSLEIWATHNTECGQDGVSHCLTLCLLNRPLLIRLGQSTLAASYWELLRYTIALFDGAFHSSHLLQWGIYRGGRGENFLFRDRRAKGWTIKM